MASRPPRPPLQPLLTCPLPPGRGIKVIVSHDEMLGKLNVGRRKKGERGKRKKRKRVITFFALSPFRLFAFSPIIPRPFAFSPFRSSSLPGLRTLDSRPPPPAPPSAVD